jgi:hypothetical protein
VVRAVRDLTRAEGAGRATTGPVSTPDPVPAATDIDLWNRDGSPVGFDPLEWLTSDVQSEFVDQVP